MAYENREATDERGEAAEQATEDRHSCRIVDRRYTLGTRHDKHSALIVGATLILIL